MSHQEYQKENQIQDNVKFSKNDAHLNKITSQTNQIKLSKIYRIFSTKKFLKWRHQYPRIQESEIINKIVNEWQNMSRQEKLQLGKTYIGLSDSDKESSQENNKISSDSQINSQQIIKNKKNKKYLIKSQKNQSQKIQSQQNQSQKIQSQQNQSQKIQSQQNQSQKIQSQKIQQQKIKIQTNKREIKDIQELKNIDYIQHQPQQQSSQDSSDKNKFQQSKDQNLVQLSLSPQAQTKQQKINKKKLRKNKPIKKLENYQRLNNGQYILFYQHYFQKLKAQHPRWQTHQINHIVVLLWRKKKQQKKKLNASKSNKPLRSQKKLQKAISKKPKRPISGKELFFKQKIKSNLRRQQINLLWQRLPRESKHDWNQRGANYYSDQIKSESCETSNAIKQNPSQQNLGRSNRAKQVVSFRNILLKGSVHKQQVSSNILEQKDQIKKRILAAKTEENNNLSQSYCQQSLQNSKSSKKQNLECISLKKNALSFLKNKISLEKI